jgi:class 3 adenylate cyclase
MGRKPDDRIEPEELPDGIVTFLLTDVEGSTPLWEQHPTDMGAALARHETLIAKVVAANAGRLIKDRGEGDSTLSVFVRASDAAAAAIALQRALAIDDRTGAIASRPGPRYTRARPSCAVATSTARRSTGRLGCAPSVEVARYCSPGPRPNSWPTSYRPGPGWSTSERTS